MAQVDIVETGRAWGGWRFRGCPLAVGADGGGDGRDGRAYERPEYSLHAGSIAAAAVVRQTNPQLNPKVGSASGKERRAADAQGGAPVVG